MTQDYEAKAREIVDSFAHRLTNSTMPVQTFIEGFDFPELQNYIAQALQEVAKEKDQEIDLLTKDLAFYKAEFNEDDSKIVSLESERDKLRQEVEVLKSCFDDNQILTEKLRQKLSRMEEALKEIRYVAGPEPQFDGSQFGIIIKKVREALKENATNE